MGLFVDHCEDTTIALIRPAANSSYKLWIRRLFPGVGSPPRRTSGVSRLFHSLYHNVDMVIRRLETTRSDCAGTECRHSSHP